VSVANGTTVVQYPFSRILSYNSQKALNRSLCVDWNS